MLDSRNLKVLVVGDSGVGKTSLINRYTLDLFDLTLNSTVGIDFSTKNIIKDKFVYKLIIWDVAGQERFKAVSNLYMRGADGCIIVTDCTKENSLENSIEWKRIIEKKIEKKIPMFLVQNKIDLIKDIDNKLIELEKFSFENNYDQFFQTSAKNKYNLDEVFSCMFEKILIEINKNSVKRLSYYNSLQETDFKNLRLNGDKKIIKKTKCCTIFVGNNN